MKRERSLRSLLRWYPPSWRARYEDEYLVFLEDRLADSELTVRFRTSVAWAGVRERSFGSGLVGTRSSPAVQRRTGSLTVLMAWSMTMIGGASFVKTAEHFSSALPAKSRTVAPLAYNTTAVAGIVGMVLVVVGAVVALPGLVRWMRVKRWRGVRRVFAPAMAASVTLVVATIALSRWAHHLSGAQRNGADTLYSGAFVVFVLLVIATVALWTRVSVIVASSLEWTPRQLRWEAALAVGVTLSAITVVAGVSLWWIQMGLHAPWFLSGSATGVAASPWTVRLIATILVLALGTVTALWGASRVALTWRPRRVNA